MATTTQVQVRFQVEPQEPKPQLQMPIRVACCSKYPEKESDDGIFELKSALPSRFHAVVQENWLLFASIVAAVKNYMASFDLSHDFGHILRVLKLAGRILESEAEDDYWRYDLKIMFLSALLHDVGDHKYIHPGEDPTHQIKSMLYSSGASSALTNTVITIVRNVSYSSEIKDPLAPQRVLQQHPELAIVQDADRLDALGAIGIGRVFAYEGAKKPLCGLDAPVVHMETRLEGIEGRMKTRTGRAMARERTRRLQLFREWWDEEKVMKT